MDLIDEDGYPTDEFLESIASFQSLNSAAHFLLNIFPLALDKMEVPSYTISVQKNGTIILTVATGGWSGAEDVINTALKNIYIHYFHTMWRRGGQFIFEISKKYQ